MPYDPNFIGEGIVVPEPTFTPELEPSILKKDTLRDSVFADYIHYSLVMNKHTKQLVYAISNLDQNLDFPYTKSTSWKPDDRVGEENQLGDLDYAGNVWDRGHMVMRDNNNWADNEADAKAANDATFFYTNAALQHENLNRDEWKALEMHIGEGWIQDDNGKLCVITGPIYFQADRYISEGFYPRGRIPGAFFKVVCFRSAAEKKLWTKAFMMQQDENTAKDQKGSRVMKQRAFVNQQISLTEITMLTGIQFHQTLYDSNPLKYNPDDAAARDYNISNFPERIEVIKPSDMVDEGTIRRVQIPRDERSVAIAALMPNPEGKDSEGEWVSLLNLTQDTIDLEGWVLEDDKDRKMELTGEMAPGESIKIETAGELILRNTGGSVELITNKHEVMDIFRYVKSEVKEGRAVLMK